MYANSTPSFFNCRKSIFPCQCDISIPILVLLVLYFFIISSYKIGLILLDSFLFLLFSFTERVNLWVDLLFEESIPTKVSGYTPILFTS